jgi:hypothetical protein
MLFLADNGFRVVAHDRRGHGRSGQPWTGNDSTVSTGGRRPDRGLRRHPRELIEDARLKVYPGAPHGITDTHKHQLGQDLLEFVKSH